MTAETAAPCVQGVQSAQTGVMVGEGNTLNQQNQQQHPKSSSHGNGNSSSPSRSLGSSSGISTTSSSSSSSTFYDPEYARMEAWLDEHPDFVNDYFLR